MKSPGTKKVLYVDDEFINLEIFKLTFLGVFEVITAISGTEGLKKFMENKDIDVVITDMNMPRMNGAEFIKQALDINKDKEFYILSGYEINEEARELIKKGIVKKFFHKPFDKEDIQKSLSTN